LNIAVFTDSDRETALAIAEVENACDVTTALGHEVTARYADVRRAIRYELGNVIGTYEERVECAAAKARLQRTLVTGLGGKTRKFQQLERFFGETPLVR
jgi:predicted MarR family transcription regulator